MMNRRSFLTLALASPLLHAAPRAHSIAIIGQSNAARLWEHGVQLAYGPASGTRMWNRGSRTWTAPVNTLITLCNTVKGQTGQDCNVLPCAINGTFMGDWNDMAPSGSLGKFLATISESGSWLKACWFVHGESDSYYGITVAQYLNGLLAMRWAINKHVGVDVPIIISPIGITERTHPYGRNVLEAQLLAIGQYGFPRGPDYHDLATFDGVHLTDSALEVFAVRGAEAIGPSLK